MKDVNYNLSQAEFSKGRKILLWFLAISASIITLLHIYIQFRRPELIDAPLSLTIIFVCVTGFLFFVAFLGSAKRKHNFFNITYEHISYQYGLLFPTIHTYKWDQIKIIFVPPHTETIILVLKTGEKVRINLMWIEKTKAKIIVNHVFRSAKTKGIEVFKTRYKEMSLK